MPLIENSTYQPHFLYKNPHINTMATSLFRQIRGFKYERKRITTPDQDFLDLDFSSVGSDTILVATHGLEGSTESTYIKGILKKANDSGWDGVAINLRSCSGEPNLQFRSYHSGMTEDLDCVLDYIINNYNYKKILLIGFSLGGNLTLKYAGEKGKQLSDLVKAVVGVSVPCHLNDASEVIGNSKNPIYIRRFLKSLISKVVIKHQLHPEIDIDIEAIKRSKNFAQFDNLYTAPSQGFRDAQDYWTKNSCLQFLPNIQRPTLLINAKDDPFLSNTCFPYDEAKRNPYFYFEYPEFGGHVAFNNSLHFNGTYWHETRIQQFFSDHLHE